MTIVESRVKQGILTFGGDPGATPPVAGTTFACQASNVHVTPSYDDDGDRIETLCGDVIPPGKKESWVIGGTSVQDFDDPEGFLTYCFANRMKSVPFTWEPNQDGAPVWTGTAVVLALEEGGDVNTRLTTDWEFELAGTPTRVYGTGTQASQPVSASTPVSV